MNLSVLVFGLVIGEVLFCSAEKIIATGKSCNSYSEDASSTGTHMIYNRESPSESCYFTFHNVASFEKTLCVKPVSLTLDCSTTIEYYRHYVGDNDFSKQMSCNSYSFDEWCGPKRTSRLYVLIKKSWNVPTDVHIDLHIYLKPFSDEEEDNIWSISYTKTSTINLAGIVCATVFPILIIITTVIIAVYCKQVRSRQSASRPLYAFQTTSTPSQGNAFPLHQIAATHPSVPVGYQPVPQTTQIPPGYHLHPMQSALPVQTQHDTSEPRLRPVQVGTTPRHVSQNTQGSRLSPRPSPRHSLRHSPGHSPRHSPGHSPRHSPRPSSRHSPRHSLRHSPTPAIDQDDPPPPYESVVKPVDSSLVTNKDKHGKQTRTLQHFISDRHREQLSHKDKRERLFSAFCISAGRCYLKNKI